MSIPSPRPHFGADILTVSRLTALIQGELESQFPEVWVEGELSGVKLHHSGHCYFSLKDARAQISCTLWRSQLARLRFRPANGMKVLARGAVGVYAPRGTYSLNVRALQPQGLGELQVAFEQLKKKLQQEGLFDPDRKRPLPFLAPRIGIVTSPTGAALQDMLKVIFRRNPKTTVVVSPAKVQGEGAALTVALGIERLNRHGQVDVIIAGRGGGSIEDLWCFNEELVARAIFHSKIPVVSAVGHEVDHTIADFVADLRAPTPSAAAELVVRDRRELEEGLRQLSARLQRAMMGSLQKRKLGVMALADRLRSPQARLGEQRRQLERVQARLQGVAERNIQVRRRQLEGLESTLLALSPRTRLFQSRTRLDELTQRLTRAIERQQEARRMRLARDIATLDALSPLAVLGRGYAIVQRQGVRGVIKEADAVSVGEEIQIRLHRGRLNCRVLGTEDG